MWIVVRGVVSFLFGDKLLQWGLYAVGALVLVGTCQSSAISLLLTSQPWGSHWMAGQATVRQQPQAVQLQPAAPRAPVPEVAAPLPQLPPNLDRVTRVLTAAMAWLGTPYLWGGCTRRGVDCSCFLQNAWASVGVSIPRTTFTQIAWTLPIPRSQVQAGDLLYFNTLPGAQPSHVGMSLGGGQMIHCGDPCQIANIETVYWRSVWNSAGRVIV